MPTAVRLTATIACLLLLSAGTVHAAAGTAAKHPAHRSRHARAAPLDPELFAGELEFDYPAGTKLDRSDQRAKLHFGKPDEQQGGPRTLAALRGQAQAGQRYIHSEQQVRGRDGTYTVVASSPVHPEEFHDPLRTVQVLGDELDFQVFTLDGALTDELGPFSRCLSMLTLQAAPGRDWVYLSTVMDGSFIFDVQPGGKLQLVLRASQRYYPAPAVEVRDVDGDGASDIVVPAGADWQVLSSDRAGACYLTPQELRRFSADNYLRPAQRIRAATLKTGVFVIYFLDDAQPLAPSRLPYAMVAYWTPERWQWACATHDLLLRQMAQAHAADLANREQLDLADHGGS